MFKRTKDFTKISPRRHKRMLLKAAKYANMEQRKVAAEYEDKIDGTKSTS